MWNADLFFSPSNCIYSDFLKAFLTLHLFQNTLLNLGAFIQGFISLIHLLDKSPRVMQLLYIVCGMLTPQKTLRYYGMIDP